MSGDGKKDEAFLARWSRRKRVGEVAPPEPERTSDLALAGSARPANDEPPPLDLATLPKIEDLVSDSDFKAFLQRGVPEEMKRMALRKAWSLDPVIRDFVEVAENQYDWNAPDGVPGFGALAEGTDLEALLAQATGQIRDLVAPDMAVARENDAMSPTPKALTDAQPSAAYAAVRPPASAPANMAPAPVSIAAAHVSAPNTEASPTPSNSRRRHGGALPRGA